MSTLRDIPWTHPLLILIASVCIAGSLMTFHIANSQGPNGNGQCCTNWCGLEPPCPGPTDFNCEMFGQVGTWPNCTTPPPADCGIGMPSGLCVPEFTCENLGLTGVYPNCIQPTCADSGLLGTWPSCYAPPQPTCADLGLLGVYPNCYAPPTCADSGLLGTWPNCYAPPTPSCADFGLLGSYPNCYAPPQPTCADLGLLGTYPSCYAPPTPSCADFGLLGSYPNCYAPPSDPDPTCADSGQLGTYPFCYDPPSGPSASVSCSPSSQSVASGGTASFTASASGGAGSPYAWLDGSNNVIGSGASLNRAFTASGSVRVRANDGSGGYVYSNYCAVIVTGGSCSNTGPLSISAAPSRVQPGGDVTLTWSASNVAASSCTVTNVNTGSDIDSATVNACGLGSETTPADNLTSQTTFRLTCGTLTKDVIVNIVPRYEEF